VWGFGRSGTSTLLKGLPCELTIGFYDGATADGVKKHIADVMKGGAVASYRHNTLVRPHIKAFGGSAATALCIMHNQHYTNTNALMQVFDIRGRAASEMKGIVIQQKR
jgi:hypothetical protein